MLNKGFIGGMFAAISLAMLVCWGAYFQLAPKLVLAIPAGQWKPLLDIVAYVIVGYVFGIFLPFFIVVAGLIACLSWGRVSQLG